MSNLDQKIRDGLKNTLSRIDWTMRDLSEATDIPYRTLQNYLSGKTKMPASTLIAICDLLRIDLKFILEGEFDVAHWPLYDALWATFGDFLLDLKQKDDLIGLENMELHNKKREHADAYSKLIKRYYQDYRYRNFEMLRHSRSCSSRERTRRSWSSS
ncbi:helix-turn-helix transcriptional regulator [Phyllobacterium sp. 628]|nr:helix-turn-helix transcriptional regulator [Phyllobacterium sp. 628]